MGKITFNSQNKNVIDSILLKYPGVVAGKMFGYPAYYINKSLFECLYENGVGIKIPERTANELIGKSGIISFQPMGKSRMKEWIQINRDNPDEYLDDEEIFIESINFISGLKQ